MNETLIHQADAAEAHAFSALFAAAPPPLSAGLGLQTREIGGACLFLAPGAPTFMFNRVIGLGNTGPVGDRDIDAVIATYRDLGVGNWWIHLTSLALRHGVGEQLMARGFTRPERRAWAKFARRPDPVAPVDTSLTIRPAETADADALGAAVITAFGMPDVFAGWFGGLIRQPDWRGFVAERDGTIMGGGMLNLQGDRAWLGVGGMRPEARGLKAHRAVMTARIQAVIDAGCGSIFTETGEPKADEPNPSYRNMQACGFEVVDSRENFAAPAA